MCSLNTYSLKTQVQLLVICEVEGFYSPSECMLIMAKDSSEPIILRDERSDPVKYRGEYKRRLTQVKQ